MQEAKNKIVNLLRWSEKYTKTDMIYLAKGSFWLNANTIITSIFAFILAIFLGNYLDQNTYGTYQFILSIGSILSALTLTGMNSAITQATARGYEGVLKESFRTQIKFGLIPIIAGLIASLYYVINFNYTLSLSILIISILIPLTNSLSIWLSFLNGKKEFKMTFAYGQIINFIYYAGMIICIILFPTTVVLISINFLLMTISNLIIYILVNKKFKPDDKKEDYAIEYGKKLSLSNILPLISLNIDNIIIFHLLGAQSLAIYSFASNIPERLGSLLRPITVLAFPKFSQKTPEEVKKILPEKILKLLIFTLACGLIYVLIAPYLFQIFFPKYTESIIYSQLYTIVIIISIVSSLPFMSLIATRSNKIFYFNIIQPIFNIAMLFYFVNLFGLIGAIIGKIIGNLFYFIYVYASNK
ncbi:MAG: oligosaccharide flippase family protein [Candidatus Paceibacterota bacterium]